MIVPITINYDDNEEICYPESEIILLYDGVEYQGNGIDHLWIDKFVDLQIKLPKDVKIACCMTCRHGNMCPYGNTKDVCINSKEDMCNLFDQTDPFEDCSVASLNFCDDFIYQNDTYYTYNDYLYQLNKKKTND